MDPTVTTQFDFDALVRLTEPLVGMMTDAKLLLFKNDLTVSRSTLFVDLDVVTQAGMLASTQLFSAPYLNGDGVPVVACDGNTFIATGGVATPFNVYGWALCNDAPDAIWFIQKLPAPVAISAGGMGLTVNPVFSLRGPTQ